MGEPAGSGSGEAVSAPTEKLDGLLSTVEGAERVVVLTHDNPDPDALASAAALATLLTERAGIRPVVAFGGIVGRVENRALLQVLELDYRGPETIDDSAGTLIALVDTQPRAGNNSLPPGRIASIVIDHHPPRPETAASGFTDIRTDYGATCSILVEYLQAAGLEPERRLATALFYAIQTETMDLGRETSEADVAASLYLYPRSDPEAIARIRHARVPASHFRSVHRAIDAAVRYGTVIAAPLERLGYPDMVAEVADLFMQMNGVDWAIAIGRHRDHILLSIRTMDTSAHAGQLIREAIGDRGSAGGHGMLAGGRINVRGLADEEVLALRDEVLGDLLEALGVRDVAPAPLVPRDELAAES